MSVYKRGGVYWYEFVFNGSRIRESTKTNSKAVAREAERARRRELELGVNRLAKRKPMPLFKAAAEQWLASLNGLADKSLASYRQYVRSLWADLGDRLICDIDSDAIVRLQRKRLAEGKSARTVNYEIHTLRFRSGSGFGAEAHREDSRRPNYTEEGARAASGSVVDEWEMPSRTAAERVGDLSKPYLLYPPSESIAPEWTVDGWLSVPFHRSGILNPLLKRAGYGMYCDSGLCAACLDVLHGASVPALTGLPAIKPIEFPPEGSQVKVRAFYSEWPDPRSSCPGYNPPSGLPITIQLGNFVSAKLEDFSLQRTNGRENVVEACAFDETSYNNLDPVLQQLGRETLHDFGMVVVLPRRPLDGGASYHVTTTVNGTKYDWSFSTRKP